MKRVSAGIVVLSVLLVLPAVLLAEDFMAHLIFADVFGRDVLPVGKPWIS